MLDAGCWMLDAGCWILDTGCWILDAGYYRERNISLTIEFSYRMCGMEFFHFFKDSDSLGDLPVARCQLPIVLHLCPHPHEIAVGLEQQICFRSMHVSLI